MATSRALLLIAVASLTAGASGPPAAPGRLYVANQESGTVSIVDAQRGTILATVDLTTLGFPATAKPHHTAVEPDGSHWYVSLIAAGKVLKLTRDNQLVGAADFATPGMLALHPTEDRLFVGRSMAAVNPPSRIGVVRRSTMHLDEVDVFVPRPHALALDARGRHLYVGSLGANQIATLSLDDDGLDLTTLDGPTHVLVQFAVSPDGTRLAATAQLTGRLLVFDTTVPTHLQLLHTIEVGAQPWHPAFTPDGREVWFGNQTAHTVTVVDATRWEVDAVLDGEGIVQPHGIAISPEGATVYVSNRDTEDRYGRDGGTVVIIDRATRHVERIVEVGRYAAGISLGPGE